MRNRNRLGLFAIGAATLMTAVLGCSSGETSDSSDGSTSVAPKANADPADQSLPPVKVGFHNLEGGAISLPDVRMGFEAGVDYVNSELGGINGQPMEVVYCNTDGTPDSSLNCGNTFVQDGVVLAAQGLDFGADGILPALRSANIAEFGSTALTPGMNAAVGDAAFGFSSTEESYSASLVQMQKLGDEKIAVIFPDVPASRSTYQSIIVPTADQLGLEIDPYYYAPGADWTTLSATVLSNNPDGVDLFAADADALAAVQALRGAGFTGTIQASRATPIIGQLDVATLENVIFGTSYYTEEYTNVPDKAANDLAIYDTYTADKEIASAAQGGQGFYTAVQAADILRQVPGDVLTAAAVQETIKTAKGEQFLGTGTYDCTVRTWPGTSACGSGTIYAKVNKDKKLETLPDQPVDVSSIRPTS